MTNLRTTKFKRWALTTAACLALVNAASFAQSSTPIKFDIDAQELGGALTEFGIQSGVDIYFVEADVKGKLSVDIDGELTPESAIIMLLQQSDVPYYTDQNGTILVGEEYVRRAALEASTSNSNEAKKEEGVEQGRFQLAQVAPEEVAPLTDNAEPEKIADQDTTEETSANKDKDEVSVTGTRLTSVPVASPVLILTRAEIDKRGLRSIDEIIRYIPQNFSTTTVGGSFDGRSEVQYGGTTVNLRGLGNGSTLILINGKRISGSPGFRSTAAEISGIPFAAIERVEVLTDGASAIYGSDAVGGVVNFILKKDYRGASVNARYENSSSGADRYVLDSTVGASWGTGNVTASLSYQRDDGILDPTKAGLRQLADFRDLGGRRTPNILAGPALHFFGPLPSNAPAGTFAAILPAGDGVNIDINDIGYVSFADFFSQTGTFDLVPTLDLASLGSILPDSESYSGNILITQELSEKVTLNLSGFYSHRDVERRFGANSTFALVPETNFYNNFGVPVFALYTFLAENEAGTLPPVTSNFTAERFNGYGSLAWEMPVEGWTAEASASFGGNIINNLSSNIIEQFFPSNPDVVAALASSDPNVALNLFGDGTAQAPNIGDLVTDLDEGSSQTKQRVFGVNFQGPLFKAPAGEVQLAFGAELRHDELDFTSTLGLILSDDFSMESDTDIPTSDNLGLYAEISAPLIGDDSAIPLLNNLGLQAAVRYDDYSIEGELITGAGREERNFNAFVTKLGLSAYPIDDLKIRGSWSESFQAPQLQELFAGAISGNGFFLDPLNPASNGGPGVAVFATRFTGGNPDLQPERSNIFTAGFDFTPSAIDGLSLSATWSRVKVDDVVSSVTAVFGSDLAFVFENPDLFPGFAVRDAAGVLTSIDQRKINLDRRQVEAIDFDARYTFGTDIGEFTIGALGTNTLKLETSVFPGIDPVVLDGTSLGPVKWNVNGFVDWTKGNWGGAVTINHESGYELAGEPNALITDVDGYTTVNLQATYALPDSGWKFAVGANNVFDADFPFVDRLAGIDSAHVDFRRRVLYLNVTKDFDFMK